MALRFENRVEEVTLTTGYGPYALGGAPLGKRTFIAAGIAIGTGQLPVVIEDAVGPNWLVGTASLLDGPALRIDTIESSSNGGGPVAFGLGTKAIYIDVQAAFLNLLASAGTIVTPGTLQLSASAYSTSEGGGPVTITVNRAGGSSGAASVNYATANGTATAGVDYTATAGTLNWADGDATPKTFTVPILQDTVVEGNETFIVTLLSAVGSSLGLVAIATVTIVDDEVSTGTLQLSAATYSVGEAAGSVAIGVTRVGGTSGAASAVVSTAAGSATAGSDFTGTTQTVNWADGDGATKTVNVPIINDTSVEGNETFTVNLGTATGANLGTPVSATVTIVDDDVADTTPPTIASRAVANATPTLVSLVFSEAMDQTSVPAASAFTISGHTVTAFAFDDATHAHVTVSAAFVNGEAARTLNYTQPGTGNLKDLAGNLLANVATAPITNNVAAPVADTRPRFANGPANATGTASVFDAFFGSATALGGSANGGKAGTLTAVGDGTNFCWIGIPASADASGLVVANSSNLHGGFSGATYPGNNADGDPADPITVRQNYTPSTGPLAGVPLHMYRRNGLLASGASASYTTS